MNIGIVTVRGPDYHPNRRLLAAAAERGHRAQLIDPYRSRPAVVGGRLVFCGAPVAVELLLPRQGAEIGDSSLALLEQAEQAGMLVVNGPDGVRLASSKYRTGRALAMAGLPVPDSVLINASGAAADAVAAVGGFPVVVKPASGRQGEGVQRFADADAFDRHLDSAGDLKRGVVVQRFIDPDGRRDLRVLVLGGKAAAAAAMRPVEGDFRSNFHLTGAAQGIEPETAVASLAVSAAAALGLEIAGVDLVIDGAGRPWVLEVNYSPGFRGLEAATGLDIAGAMVAHMERLVAR